eukprot:1157356-Pelagomonas_calceolata.AAC.7
MSAFAGGACGGGGHPSRKGHAQKECPSVDLPTLRAVAPNVAQRLGGQYASNETRMRSIGDLAGNWSRDDAEMGKLCGCKVFDTRLPRQGGGVSHGGGHNNTSFFPKVAITHHNGQMLARQLSSQSKGSLSSSLQAY